MFLRCSFYSKCLFLLKCGFITVSTSLQVQGLVSPTPFFWNSYLNLTLVLACRGEAWPIWPFGIGNDFVPLNLEFLEEKQYRNYLTHA